MTPDWIAAIGTAAATVLLALGYVVPPLYRFIRRPRLNITFGRGGPWSRITRMVPSENIDWKFGLFVRVHVFNDGYSPAHLVRGRFQQFLDRNGIQDPLTDPYDLHWVGTDQAQANGITLLPKHGEYLDLFYVPGPFEATISVMRRLVFYPQDHKPRGMPPVAGFEGHHMIIRVAGEDADAVGIEIQLPDGGALGDAVTNGFRYRLLQHGDMPGDWQG